MKISTGWREKENALSCQNPVAAGWTPARQAQTAKPTTGFYHPSKPWQSKTHWTLAVCAWKGSYSDLGGRDNSSALLRKQNQFRLAVRGFTLVEMLVVIVIISILLGLMFPALNAAREASRSTTCQNNLKQFYVGMLTHAQTHGKFCSGAMDWNRDGCVTEVGWVADLVQLGIPVGKMLCPSNPALLTETYQDLLGGSSLDPCVDHLGSPPKDLPDGSQQINPCRRIIEQNLAPGSEARTQLVFTEIHKKFYNTNYTASWFLVRTGVRLDASGNLTGAGSGCEVSLASRGSTLGPLSPALLDSSPVPNSLVPIMGCGASVGQLSQAMGSVPAGTFLTKAFTTGPVRNPEMTPPTFAPGTPRTGPNGWWAGWNATRQDYRGFAPVHRGYCNVLFGDGSVRQVKDLNQDFLINNGFTASGSNGFADSQIEWPPEEVFSGWSLRDIVSP